MSGKCSVLAHVRNPKGEVVESRLYNDLLHYTSNNRGLTKEYYAVGTDPEFLESVRDSAEFDENGEITFESLRRLANLQIDEDAFLKALNKEVGAGTYDYDEAMTRMVSFNRGSSYKKIYMATIKQSDNGKYELFVVRRSTSEEVALNKVIADQTLQNKIKFHLAKAGVSVKFMEMDEKVRGRYSTRNAQKTARGLYQLVEIATNGSHIDETLAEEAGHFAIGALGDSPLVKRLTDLLSPKVQKEILGEDYDEKSLGESSVREAAGVAVGKALIHKLENRTVWQNIAHRIANLAKKIFATVSGNEVMKTALEVESIALDIAEGFISDNFEGSVETALETRETLFDEDLTIEVKSFRTVVESLRRLSSEMRGISEDLFKKFDRLAGQVEMNKARGAHDPFAGGIALEGIVEAVTLLTDMMNSEIPELLNSVNIEDIADFYKDIPKHARSLQAVTSFVKNVGVIIQTINEAALSSDVITILDSNGLPVSYKIYDITRKLEDLVLRGNKCPAVVVKTKKKQLFLAFLEQVHGKNYVDRAARVLLESHTELVFDEKGNPVYKRDIRGNIKKDRRGNPIQKTRHSFIKKVNASRMTLEQILESLDEDIGFFERFIGSMSNNSDIVGQLADKATKHANQEANRLTRRDWETLRGLEERFNQLKKRGLISDMREIYEVDSKRVLTGNFRSEYNIGAWEEAYRIFREEALEEFRATHNLEGKSDFQVGVEWNAFFKPKVKMWHDKNSLSVVDSFGNLKRVPNHKYKDPSWDNLSPEVQEFIGDIYNFKAELDRRIGHIHTVSHRVPQLRGTFIDRMKNRIAPDGVMRAVGNTTWQSIVDTFCESSVDTDYGGESTYNSESEYILPNKMAYEDEKINRVPMFGINKLPDMTELSTDVFRSLLAYATMANKCAALNLVADVLSVGKDVLFERKVAGHSESEHAQGSWKKRLKQKVNRSSTSYAYTRYTKFLDKQVYGINQYKLSIGRFVVNKITGFLNRAASVIFLGGNVHGGIVNFNTGFTEIFKEAMSGEYFDMKDWAYAVGLYTTKIIRFTVNLGKEVINDKVSLFLQYYDALNTTEQDTKNWNTRRPWIINFFGKSLFLPYKIGEHFMHGIPYIALAKGTKLYDINGDETTLLDALELEDLSNVKKGKRLKIEKRRYFKDKDSIPHYQMLSDIISQIDKTLNATSPFGAPFNPTEEQRAYLQEKGYEISSPKDLENTKTKLMQEADRLIWTDDDDIAFKIKAQEVCIRMHGIYNNADQTAIQQEWWGQLLTSMKGYALGLFERRFGSSKYNEALGGETGGSINDLAKVFLYVFENKKPDASFLENLKNKKENLHLLARALFLPWGKKTKEMMLKEGFSMHQYYNMRRNFMDFGIIAALTLVIMLTARDADDGEDEDETTGEQLEGLAFYFSSRLLREQAAFNTPGAGINEYNNLLDPVPVGVSAIINVWETADLLIGQHSVEPQNRRVPKDEQPEDYTKYYYNDKKEDIYDYGDSKGEEKALKMIPYYKSFKPGSAFDDPYGAYESFEYGQKVKQ